MNSPFQTSRRKTWKAVTSTNDLYSKSLSLIELLVVIAVIFVLVTILMPAFRKVREIAATAQCMSNQRQIVTAFILYAGENNGQLPQMANYIGGFANPPWWYTRIRPYLGIKTNSTQVVGSTYMRCPAEKDASVKYTYGVNYSYGSVVIMGLYAPGDFFHVGSARLSKLSPSTMLLGDTYDWGGASGQPGINNPRPDQWVLDTNACNLAVFDSDANILGGVPSGGPYNRFAPRHGGGTCAQSAGVCAFADGSVRKVSLLDWATNKENMWGP